MQATSARSKFTAILSLLLIGVCAGVVADQFTDVPQAADFAAIALVAFALIGSARFDWRERYLLLMAGAAIVVTWQFAADPAAIIRSALHKSSYLAAFMILLSLLREAASTSRTILTLGLALTGQPPGRRYIAVSGGGHFLGIVLNFGALSLLGPLIQRGITAANHNDGRDGIREQRQISALARGFSWFVTWSPTSVTQALIPTIVAGSEHGLIMLLGVLLLIPVSLAGWLEDRLRFPANRRSGHTVAPAKHLPLLAIGKFFAICTSLTLLSVLASVSGAVPLVTGLMLCAPVITVIWITLQQPLDRAGLACALNRVRTLCLESPANGAPEALALSCAGFIGIALAGTLADKSIELVDQIAALPPVLLSVAIITLIPVVSNLGAHPIMVVTFAGGLLSSSPALATNPSVLAVAFIAGWAVNLTCSPFSATNLVLSRTTAIPGTTLAWKWNGWFSIIACTISAICLGVFALLLPA